MTRKQDSAGVRRWSEEIRKALSEDRDLLKTIVEETLQQLLEGEMEEALQAGKSERTETRLGYRAGYYQRTLVTRVGKVEWRVPQDRQGRFRTEVFERYQRSEKPLVAAMLEMYGQGVSTRKSQNHHRRAVRARIQFGNHQPDRGATGCRTGEVRQATFRRTVSRT